MKNKIMLAALTFFLFKTIQPKFFLNIKPSIKKTAYFSIGSLCIVNAISSCKKYGLEGLHPVLFFKNISSLWDTKVLLVVDDFRYDKTKIEEELEKLSEEQKEALRPSKYTFPKSIPSPIIVHNPIDMNRCCLYFKNKKDQEIFTKIVNDLRLRNAAKRFEGNSLSTDKENEFIEAVIKKPLMASLKNIPTEDKKQSLNLFYVNSELEILLQNLTNSNATERNILSKTAIDNIIDKILITN